MYDQKITILGFSEHHRLSLLKYKIELVRIIEINPHKSFILYEFP